MKKEAARMIKTAVAIIAMLAAVICYNVGWNNSAGTTALMCSGFQDSGATAENAVGIAGNAVKNSGDTLENADKTGARDQDAAPKAGSEPDDGGRNPMEQEKSSQPGTESEDDGTAGGTTGRIFIHVCGEVTVPGVYGLEEGSRIYQAIEMAGGFTEDAAQDFLNMAESLEDGMKIQVPNRKEAGEWDSRKAVTYPEYSEPAGRTQEKEAAGAGGFQERSNTGTAKVNLNTAAKEQLMTLKGIGEARAEAIIAYRQESGPFTRIEDIMEVSGIKEAAFQKIKEDITV
ncbi:helix-hairpin-helix domain-containing protein [[Clostridium] symbiosum]|uniref:helix-hairpin-helix domain-containing protein n=1 Tax=Clostridium symbiosum TaxID=1512 RepID=UPI001D07DC86|nr:helix-hairpin-helix domain-containing protein [[Clostridium] symbiosum]MCB6610434.1 helix-hairpin-helix domain-containing protein [[Clostridium] symbiosum]MCB6931595.1 helix-hairpin-helix domain-containing protein [[Clostridium] symbiosum]